MQRDTARFLLERTPEVAGLSLSADLEAADTCDQAGKLQTGQLHNGVTDVRALVGALHQSAQCGRHATMVEPLL